MRKVNILADLELEPKGYFLVTSHRQENVDNKERLGVPCVTLRENTERPETLDVGANVLAGTVSQRIMDGARNMLEAGESWKNPFGDGNAGQRIIQILEN